MSVRLDPVPWSRQGDGDREGKVDFDDDEGATILTVWVQREFGKWVLHAQLMTDLDEVVAAVHDA